MVYLVYFCYIQDEIEQVILFGGGTRVPKMQEILLKTIKRYTESLLKFKYIHTYVCVATYVLLSDECFALSLHTYIVHMHCVMYIKQSVYKHIH